MKTYKGPIKNKERSIQKLLDAVGVVIKTKGYIGLTATNIAKESGLSRRLITQYFDSVDDLVETYVRGKDYWLLSTGNVAEDIETNTGQNTEQLAVNLLINQLDYFSKNEEMQKLILWQISESNQIMTEICQERELLSSVFFALSDKELKGKDIDLRAVASILVAGIYYLILHQKSTDTTFCEIDLRSADGIHRIKQAIKNILKQTYANTYEMV